MTDAPNPLLEPPTLPYQVPPYDSIHPAHYLPAFTEAFAQHRA